MFSRRAKQWARIFVTSLWVLFLIRAGLESVSASELNNNPADYNGLYCKATYITRIPTDLDKNTLASIISGKAGLLKNFPAIPLDIDNSLIITQSGEDLWLIPSISENKFKIVFAVIKDDKLQGISLSLDSSDTKNPTIILSDLEETISYEIPSDKAQMIVDSVASLTDPISCIWEIFKKVFTAEFNHAVCTLIKTSASCAAVPPLCPGFAWGSLSEWVCAGLISGIEGLIDCLIGNESIWKPTVTTLEPSNIASTSATLNGSVNPNGKQTVAFFKWGLTTSYGNLLPQPPSTIDVGKGSNAQTISASLAGLQSGVTYHYKIVASNENGLAEGVDMSFKADGSLVCEHSECVPGVKLKNGCSSCVTTVCAKDSYCCNNNWDGLCADEAKQWCGSTCVGCTQGSTQTCKTSGSCPGQQVCGSDGKWGSCTATGTHKECSDGKCVSVSNTNTSCKNTCTSDSNCSGGCAHSECVPGVKLKNDCSSCVTTVCAKDSFCCNNNWDGLCVNEAKQWCGSTCK